MASKRTTGNIVPEETVRQRVDTVNGAVEVERVTRRTRWGDQHWYRVYGDPMVTAEIPGATTALSIINKPALIPWAVKTAVESYRAGVESYLCELHGAPVDPAKLVELSADVRKRPDQVRDAAADYGTRAHAAVETIIKAELEASCQVVNETEIGELLGLTLDPSVMPSVRGFLSWRTAAGITVLSAERLVYSCSVGYAGTIDIDAMREGRRIVADLKTSNGLWDEYALQIASYAHALMEMTGATVHEGWALRVPKSEPDEGQPAFEARKIGDLQAAYQAFRAAAQLQKAMQAGLWAKN